jgi:hypothetical protein
MDNKNDEEIIETDKDTMDEDGEGGSLYPYPPAPDIDNIEVDVRENPYSVYELSRQYDKKTLKTNPEFQRNLVWSNKQKSWFIESIILNIPLPHLYFNQDQKGKYIVVDGLQRTTTIHDYLNDKFDLQELEAIPWLNGKRFSDLDTKLKARIEDRKLPCYIVKSSVPIKMIYDIFKRINTGGTQLQRQEIRNCIYLGRATKLLKELSAQSYFKRAIDNGISGKRMKDQEAVLRYISFRVIDYDKYYKNDMDDFLGVAMKKINKELSRHDIDELKNDFRRVMGLTLRLFGYRNFRIPTSYSRGRINIAVLESVGSFFSKKTDKFILNNKETIIDNYFNRLMVNEEYLDAVKISTGDSKRVKKRFDLANKILGEV